jgi:hypothetical protein
MLLHVVDKRKKRLIYVKPEGARADEGYRVSGELTFSFSRTAGCKAGG